MVEKKIPILNFIKSNQLKHLKGSGIHLKGKHIGALAAPLFYRGTLPKVVCGGVNFKRFAYYNDES